MAKLIKKMWNEKKVYREQMMRVAALPDEYRFVYGKMQKYMWSQSRGDGFDMLKTQYELIDLFEAGVAEGRSVLDITGEDVASFCDELLRENKLWMDLKRRKLNQIFKKRFKKNKEIDGD